MDETDGSSPSAKSSTSPVDTMSKAEIQDFVKSAVDGPSTKLDTSQIKQELATCDNAVCSDSRKNKKKLGVIASGSGKSTLNPNAPPYIPAAFQQVEDFSPEWWDLIKTSKLFHGYWLSQHQETEIMYGNNESNFEGDKNVVDLLPDEIDIGVDEELLNMESQFEEFIKFSESQESKLLPKDGVFDTNMGSKLGSENHEKAAEK